MAVISEAIIGFTFWLTVRVPFCLPRVKNNPSCVQGSSQTLVTFYSAYWFQIVSWKSLSRVSIWEKLPIRPSAWPVFLCVRSSLAFHLNFENRQSFQKLFLVTRQTACSNRSTNSKRVSKSGMVNKWDRKRERKRVWWIKCPLLKCSDPTCQLHHSEWSITAHISKTLLLSPILCLFFSFFHRPLTNLHSIPLA